MANRTVRALLPILLVGICFQCIASAADPITFSPPLASAWVVKTNREIQSQDGITVHLVVLQSTNQGVAVMVTLIRCTQAQIAKGFERNARNHFGGSLDSWISNPKARVADEKFIIKKKEDRKIAEASCRIKLSGQTLFFYGNCWLSKTNLVSWVALSEKGGIKDDKDLRTLADSIKVVE